MGSDAPIDLRMSIVTSQQQTVEITTGARPARVTVWLCELDGVSYLTGPPGRPDWYADLVAKPSFTVHLEKNDDHEAVDLRVRARPVLDRGKRYAVFSRIRSELGQIDAHVAGAPLIEIEIPA
jgi:hypothetical protein